MNDRALKPNTRAPSMYASKWQAALLGMLAFALLLTATRAEAAPIPPPASAFISTSTDHLGTVTQAFLSGGIGTFFAGMGAIYLSALGLFPTIANIVVLAKSSERVAFAWGVVGIVLGLATVAGGVSCMGIGAQGGGPDFFGAGAAFMGVGVLSVVLGSVNTHIGRRYRGYIR